jgi:hypothetical protein
VRLRRRVGDPQRDAQRPHQIERLACGACGGQHRLQRRTVEPLQHREGLALRGTGSLRQLAREQHRDHVGVRDAAGEARLAVKFLQPASRQLLQRARPIRRGPGGEHLDRHRAVDPGLVGTVDPGRGADAGQTLDAHAAGQLDAEPRVVADEGGVALGQERCAVARAIGREVVGALSTGGADPGRGRHRRDLRAR